MNPTTGAFMTKRMFLGIALGIIALLFLLAGQVLSWHDSIINPGYTPWAMPLIGGLVFPPPRIYPLSYGLVCLLLMALAIVAAEMRRPIPVAWSAFFLLMLGLNCPLQIGFAQPSWLEGYLNCLYQYLTFSTFAGQNSLPFGAPAIEAKSLQDVEGLADRLDATWISMRIGWIFHVIGAAILLVAALIHAPSLKSLRTFAFRGSLVVLFVLMWNLSDSVIGVAEWKAGQAAEREGNLAAARADYHAALSWDKWNRMIPRVYERLGAIDAEEHLTNSGEYHFQQGLYRASSGDPEYAMQEFTDGVKASADPDLKRLCKLTYALVATAEANTFSSPVAAPSAAAEVWKNAANIIPGASVAQHYMAARGFQSSGQYKKAAQELALAQDQGVDVVLKAQIFSSIGDVDFLSGKTPQARLDYLASQKLTAPLTEYKNSRAMKALTDNLQQ